jgi:hypothetical protein
VGLTLEPLPPVTPLDEDANMGACNFKAKLQILGVIREDCGTGKDWKQASTDAMKRVAVRFGIGHELYAYEQNWVQMDGDGKYAKPIEDPAVAYARRYGRPRLAATPAATSRPRRPARRLRRRARRRRRRERDGTRVARTASRRTACLRRAELPEVRWADVGQPAHEAEPEGAGLQVPRPFVRRRDLASEAGQD